jgi:hypothetical protein
MRPRFYCGMDHCSDADRVQRSCISVRTIRKRKSGFNPSKRGWIMDSGAFTEISTHGCYVTSHDEYGRDINRWHTTVPGLQAAVAQDWMCEDFILEKTGKTIAEHQSLTVESYDEVLRRVRKAYLMPVLQGYEPREYLHHLSMYGSRLKRGAWVGVGSLCKRNIRPSAISDVLGPIKRHRPDLKLHGFGIKTTSLQDELVSDLLWSCDSMAWSFAARMKGRNQHSPLEAIRFVERISKLPIQRHLFGIGT